MSDIDIAMQFVDAISRQDVDGIYELMSTDHIFIDGMGNTVRGRETMKTGWISYFKMVPDYKIEVEEVFGSGHIVVLLGKASGTYSLDGNLKTGNHWEVPAAWRAEVAGDKIRQWQVYADNEPIRQIIRRENE
jgi:ketosteroid isomerase-like protein